MLSVGLVICLEIYVLITADDQWISTLIHAVGFDHIVAMADKREAEDREAKEGSVKREKKKRQAARKKSGADIPIPTIETNGAKTEVRCLRCGGKDGLNIFACKSVFCETCIKTMVVVTNSLEKSSFFWQPRHVFIDHKSRQISLLPP